MTSESDADECHKAMKGLGTDDRALVNVLAHRTPQQLQAIAASYQTRHGKTLHDAIKSDTSGDYRKLLCSLVKPRGLYYAKQLHKAVDRIGTDDGALIDILCFASNVDIKAAAEVYFEKYKKNLVDDIRGDTSGNYKQLLTALLRGTRDEAPFNAANHHIAEKDAEALYKKGEGRLGTDDDFFIDFFATHSYTHIRAVDAVYTAARKHSLAEAVKKETSGEYQRALMALAEPREVYFAKRLHHSVAGLGTKDRNLRRIFVLNDKAQLRAIATAYEALYKKSAERDVQDDTSGWYSKLLVSLLN